MDFTDLSSLGWLWRSSWQGTALAAVVFLVQSIVGQRLNARWRHALWWVVVAKLLVPTTIPLPVSAYPEWAGLGIRFSPLDANSGGLERGASLRVPRVSLGGDSAAAAGALESMAATSGEVSVSPDAANFAASVKPASQTTGSGKWAHGLPWIWGVGAIGLLMRHFIHGVLLTRRLRSEWLPAGPPLLRLVEWCRNELGIRRSVRVCLVAWLRGPAVFNWRRPVILLPESMASELDERSMRHVVLHELAHVRRGDLGMNLVLVVLQAVHWFNPVLWLVFRRMRADRELAADELSMACLEPSEARAYGATLIRAVELRAGFRSSRVALGMVGGKACFRRRIQAVARFDATRRGVLMGRVALVALLAVGFAGPAREVKPQDPAQPPVMTNYYRVEKRARPASEIETQIAEIRDAETRWISGEVVDEAGNAIPNAQVIVAPFGEPRLHRDVGVTQGRFEIAVLDSEERVVALQAPGFAPRFLRRTGDRNRTLQKVVLDPGRIIEGTVIDEGGVPLAAVLLGLQSDAGERLDDPLVKLEVTTDVDGRFRWTNAPVGGMRLVAGKDGFEPAMTEILRHPSTSAEFRLRRAFELQLRLTDEATGAPVEPSEVLTRWVPWGFIVKEVGGWQRSSQNVRIETAPGLVKVGLSRRMTAVPGDLQLQVVAPDFRPEITEVIKVSGAQERAVRFRRAERWLGRVTDPQGNAVSGAQVTLLGQGMISLDPRGRLVAMAGLGPGVIDTGVDGEFELPTALPSARVVAAHAYFGYAEIEYGELERTKVVQLKPWGGIEGALKSGSDVVEGADVFLKRAHQGTDGMDLLSYRAITGPRGQFRFDKVPPGSVLLCRSWSLGGDQEMRSISPKMAVEVFPGQISQVTLGGGGRTIVGQVIANPGGRTLPEHFGHHGMFRRRAPRPGLTATREEHEAWAKSSEASSATEFTAVYTAVWQGHEGRFIVEDVPPGTYELQFGFVEWQRPDLRGLPRPLGNVSKEVVVPNELGDKTNDPLDVGILRVTLDLGENDTR
jgi:beta-lactamase regulating signal transducer with metallopeptidase domain